MYRTPLLVSAALLLAAGGLAACGMSSESDFLAGDSKPGAAGDAAAQDGGFVGSPSDGIDLPPVDNAIILVHAAKSQAFRLCFTNELTRRPAPDSETMPEANVVGVEVGAAVRLPPLAGAPGDVYLFDEPLIRAYYPQFGGAGAGPTCSELLASSSLSKLGVKVATITKDLHLGVHLLVLEGCPANGPISTFTTAECGSTWTPSGGNLTLTETELTGARRSGPGALPAQVVNLSQPLDSQRGARSVRVAFGDLATPGATLTPVATDPPLYGGAFPAAPVPLTYPAEDLATYGTYGLRVSIGGNADGGSEDAGPAVDVLDQTLDVVQRQSSPTALPQEYYAAASNYVFLLLGDPAPRLRDGGADGDARRTLHLLAIPVISPDAAGDGGSPDAGEGTP
ncbi:MAG: hypothetical protein JWP97_2027 [Labilithrix sp.]|nr:hypothetical protein [Labilithrix sp.]